MKQITFLVDDQKIVGHLFTPIHLQEKNPAVLLITGWKSSQERLFKRAEALAQNGFVCLTFDFRSFGQSAGDREQLKIKDYLRDVSGAYDYLRTLDFVYNEKIGVVGSSFGGYLATLLTNERSVPWLVLTAPAMYHDSAFEKVKVDDTEEIREWRHEKLQVSDSRALRVLADYSGSVLLIELGKDTDVPAQTCLNYLSALSHNASVDHVVFKDSPHRMPDEQTKTAYIQLVTSWFKKQGQES